MARFTSHSRERVGQTNKARGGKNTVTITNRGKIKRPKSFYDMSPFEQENFLNYINLHNISLETLTEMNNFAKKNGYWPDPYEIAAQVYKKKQLQEKVRQQLLQSEKNAAQRRAAAKNINEKVHDELLKRGIDLSTFKTMGDWHNGQEIYTLNHGKQKALMSDVEQAVNHHQYQYYQDNEFAQDTLSTNTLNFYWGDGYRVLKGYILNQDFNNIRDVPTPYVNYYSAYLSRIKQYQRYEKETAETFIKDFNRQLDHYTRQLQRMLVNAPTIGQDVVLFHGGAFEVTDIGEIGKFMLPTSTSFDKGTGDSFLTKYRYPVKMYVTGNTRGLVRNLYELTEREVTFPINQEYLVVNNTTDAEGNITSLEILLDGDVFESNLNRIDI